MVKKTPVYKLYLRRKYIREGPFSMNVELTNNCNLRCWMCPRKDLERLEVREIDFEVFKKFVDDVAEIQDNQTVFSPVGLGEPLLYSRLEDALAYVKEKLPGVPIHLTSNATVLNEKNSEMLCRLLGKDDSILFSINAWNKDTYNKQMGFDLFDQVVKNVKRFIDIRDTRGKLFIQVQIIKTKDTIKQIKDFTSFWQPLLKNPRDRIYIRELENWGGQIDTKNERCEQTPKRYPCASLWTLAAVDKDGNAYPCCEAFSTRDKSQLLLGNIKDRSLKEIYSGKKLKILRMMHTNAEWDKIKECSKCDFWASTNNVWFKNGKRFV